jgi:formate hydrogenlyase subunit 6/NADH:ubiquinone oxidoreductase subunit I
MRARDAGTEVSRRSFLRTGSAVGGMAALAAALSPLRELITNPSISVEVPSEALQGDDARTRWRRRWTRIRAKVEERYQVRPHLRDVRPMDGVEFVYALNLSRCIGCRKCVHACVAENNQSALAGDSVHPRDGDAAGDAGP